MEKLKQLKLKHIPLLLAGLILVFCLLVWAINLSVFDEEPSAGVLEVMKPHSMPRPEQNAYFMLHGFTADNEKDPLIVGQAIMEKYFQNKDELGKDEITQVEMTEILGGADLDKDWYEAFERCRSRTDFSCLQKNLQQSDVWKNKSERLKLMLQRYNSLIAMTEYQQANGLTFYTPMPGFGYPMTLHQIKLAEAYQSQDFELFLQQIENDTRFWRMILAKGNALIDKMVAVAAIWNNLSYLSYAISDQTLTETQVTHIKKILTPLSQDELDISESFIYEAQYMYRQLENISTEEYESFFGPSYWIFSQLVQTNATNNRHYEEFVVPLIKHAKEDSQSFAKSYPLIRKQFEQKESIGWTPSNLYNLGGKMLVSYGVYMANDYSARVHDLNGMFSLVNIQLSLVGTTKQNWKQAIQSSRFKNPYTGNAFEFDETKMQLGFDCLDKSSVCTINL